ncbi:unnamed protein product [Protopolystoma xenopodis]|uniref:Uncharacterized protein n=1 Tax=Protopolystoma xenopodis TaxID=117903 RepID=A0A448WAL0_9PLAT|nr:unnamed protein product [Protopolystoma xenopodis]
MASPNTEVKLLLNTSLVISNEISSYPYAHTVVWQIPESGGAFIRAYRIRIRKVSIAGFRVWHASIPLSGEVSSLKTNWTSEPMEYPVIESQEPWRYYQPELVSPMLNSFRLNDLDPEQIYQVVIEAGNDYGYSLDGVDLDAIPAIPRIPESEKVQAFVLGMEQSKNEVRQRLLIELMTKDLVRTSSLFVTTMADQIGRPLRIFGSASHDSNVSWRLLSVFFYIQIAGLFYDLDWLSQL